MSDKQSLRGVPLWATTKQSGRFDGLKVPSLSRDWIATARHAVLAMTSQVERVDRNALEASWGQAAPPPSAPAPHA